MSVVVNYYDRIQDSTNITKAFLAVLMACFTGILAQVVIPPHGHLFQLLERFLAF